MGHARQSQGDAGPPAASPTWLGVCLGLTFKWRALLPSGLGHQPVLWPPASASSWVSEALQAASLSLVLPTLHRGVNDRSPRLDSLT